MKKRVTKAASLTLIGALTVGLTAYASPVSAAEFEKTKIGVCLYEDSTEFSKGMQEYIRTLGEAMNCEVTFGLYSMMDEAANIEMTTQLISAGVQGIIGTADVGTSTIIDECEAAGVYYASYLNDLNASFAMDYDHVFGSEYFLGAIADGYTSDSNELGLCTRQKNNAFELLENNSVKGSSNW